MNFDESTYEKIEQFLAKELKGDALRNFEDRLNADKALAEEVALAKDMNEFLNDGPENELRRSLQALGDQALEESTEDDSVVFPFRYLFLLLFFILLSVWWFVGTEQPLDIAPTLPTPTTVTPIDSFQNAPQVITEKPPIASIEDSTKSEGPLISPIEKKQTSTPPKKLVDSRVFQTNPKLEDYVNSRLLGNLTINLQERVKDISIGKEKETINFKISGILQTSNGLEDNKLKVYIFSNDPQRFQNSLPISSHELSLDKVTEYNYEFRLNKFIELPSGLYYYLIEETGSKDVLYADKFNVINGPLELIPGRGEEKEILILEYEEPIVYFAPPVSSDAQYIISSDPTPDSIVIDSILLDNPVLDSLMLRVTEDSLGITIFEKTEYGAPTDNDDFHKIFLYGIFDSTTILQNKNFTLHLFTNKPETFQDFQPVTSFEILVKEDRSFLFEKFVALEPGLYYYLVEEKESKIIYFVDKFVVYDF